MKRYSILLVSLISIVGCNSVPDPTGNIVAINFDDDSKFHTITRASAEIIPVSGIPLFAADDYQVITQGNDYYLYGTQRQQNAYRIDSQGYYLNDIGRAGRGPDEYLRILDFYVDDELVRIYEGETRSEICFDRDGKLIEKSPTEFQYKGIIPVNGGYWMNLGYLNSDSKYRLIYTTNTWTIREEYLDAKIELFPMIYDTPSFYKSGNEIYMRDIWDKNIYQINEDNTVVAAYTFDLGPYSIPDNYYTQDDPYKAVDILYSQEFGVINRFMSNEKYAVVEVYFQDAEKPTKMSYGLLNKEDDKWVWITYSFDDVLTNPFIGKLKWLSEDSELIFLVDSYVLTGMEESVLNVFSNKQIIEDISEDDNPVIIKYQLP